MERKRENPKLIPYIEQFLIEKLENCELFVNAYGKGFVEARLYENFKRLYTEETHPRYAGEYSLGGSGAMTLYAKGSDGNMLTFDDIKEDSDLQTTTLHEGIHAIFNKTPEECAALGIRMGSGMHFIYDGIRNEIGRGANEGFTNWLCEKAGLKTRSYPKLTRIIKLIEKAIGEEKVIQFGKGDIENNIAPLLQLSPEECALFLSKADAIYDFDELAHDYSDVRIYLDDKIRYQDTPKDEIPEYVTEHLQKLEHNALYKKILKNPDYLTFAEQQGLDPKEETTKQKYFDRMSEMYSNRSNEMVGEMHTTLITMYFSKELDDILQSSNDCGIEQYQKFCEIKNLLADHKTYSNDILKTFKSKIDELKTRFCGKAIEDIKHSLTSGTLTPEKFEAYQELFENGDYKDSFDFRETISEMMLPEDPQSYSSLYVGLANNKQLSRIFDYKILSLQSPNGSRKSLFLDTKGNNSFSRFVSQNRTIQANEELSEDDRIFDITLGNLQEIQLIVNNFIELKEKIKSKNPNAQLEIIDDVIITTNEHNEVQFYMVDGNDIVPVSVTELTPQNRLPLEQLRFDSVKRHTVKPEELVLSNTSDMEIEEVSYEENETALVPVSKNPFKKIFDSMKGAFSKFKDTFFNNYKPSKDSKPVEEINVPKTTPTSFDDRIHVDVSGKYEPLLNPEETTIETISKDDEYTK